ncbi:MAG: Mur ligase family protein, partial [Candidatus Aquilonibacter sp.]
MRFAEAVVATGAQVYDTGTAPSEIDIATDTRTLAPGQTFLALHGERFDGHAYVSEAIERGAKLLIVDNAEAIVPGTAALLVRDTLHAYLALASAARAKFRGRVLAITGSTGKTTTKAFAMQLLATRYNARVLAAPANENNEVGVSKLLLAADNDAHDVLIVEMGARHYGDIETLVRVTRPDLGILTNVGDAHLEIMGSRERLEETKWALFATGARAILNAGDVTAIRRAPSLAAPPHWFFSA